MKTLSNHTMVYDADCPLCAAYTKSFVTTEMLDKNGRVPYQQVGGSFCPGMDEERSKNEIALVNLETGEVKYGLESLLTIIEHRYKWMGTVARIQPLKFFLQKLYNFISYNRKVIAPVSSSAVSESAVQTRFDCTPTFKLKYRLAYIVFVWLVTSLVLVEYSHLLGDLIPATNFYREFLICGGQVLFQSVAVGILLAARVAVPTSEARRRGKPERLIDYLGNMMTVSFIGALLLLPVLLLGSVFAGISPVVFLAYFMLVVGVMLYEHARRMKLMELGGWPSVSWVLYRMLVLALIVF
jgi:predicted DCC family thiol-disulfide oxidoreductase YuxK